MTEVEQPPQNGIGLSAAEEDENSKPRPADIEQDMREMERRKRVEAIMGSKLFREELERIVDSAREGGASGILQQLSDIVGVPVTRVGNVFKTSNCMVPINDIRGVESMGYAKGEKILRCKLAATFRLLDLYGWTQGLGAQITARLKVDQEYFLVNPYGLLYHEITASALNKVDMQGNIVEQGTTNFGVNKSHFILHSVVHAARPDIRCAIYIGCSPVVAISSLKTGLLPLTKDACVLGEITTYSYTGTLDEEERNKLVRNLGPNSKVILLANHGALCCGETIEEAFFAACHIVQACETQLKLLPVGVDNLVLIPEESRKIIYEQSRRPPEDLEKKFAAALATAEEVAARDGETAPKLAHSQTPKWRVGGAEFEALMRMLDNAGYRTGYIYRHPLVKSEPPKPKNDVELPPAVSSLGYLLEEEELFKQGIWKKGDLRKGGDRSRWLNSPNVYQKVEVLETGTPDPKKITKWVAEGSPTHSTPVRIEDPLQFVPAGTTTKEFKRLQQQIKDNRRADKISAGPQSHILEGVTWDEANRIKDATVSQTGDHVVLMGAASKGIIQRGFQHNATVYKAPYAKNPFDNVTDDELNEYKRTVERKKKSIHGEYTDTDFSESEALSSLQTSGAHQTKQTTTTAAVSQSEPETSEHQVLRIETQQAPVPSQAEVVLSDAQQKSMPHYTLIQQQQHIENEIKTYKNNANYIKMRYAYLERKYAFLYEPSFDFQHVQNIHLYVIQKLENLTEPINPLPNSSISNSNNNNKESNNDNSHSSTKVGNKSASYGRATKTSHDAAGALAPFRTVSHFGFNYPVTYLPNVTVHPSCLLTPVELQRQKVIAFINSTTTNYAKKRPLLPATTAAASTTAQVSKAGAAAALLSSMPQTSAAGAGEDSFISVKEIHLETNEATQQKLRRRKQRNSNSNASTNAGSANEHTSVNHIDIDALSEQFSSVSLQTYASPSNTTHSQHDEHDSCYNSSTFTVQRPTEVDNLYRSFVLRKFLPIHTTTNVEHDLPQHKPAAVRAFDADILHPLAHSTPNMAHVKLSVSALKLHSSPKTAKRTVSATYSEEAASTSSSSGASSLKSIEIHVNVIIKNADCAKTLHTHEHEFLTKLHCIIDNELHSITQQLHGQQQHQQQSQHTQQQQQQRRQTDVRMTSQGAHAAGHSPAPSNATFVHDEQPHAATAAAGGAAAGQARLLRRNSAPDLISNCGVAAVAKLSYEHNLALLAHELENLLNSILHSNELHNRAFICECKEKISEMTADICNTLKMASSQRQDN